MRSIETLYHVRFRTAVNGGTDFYFGSLAAIFGTFTAEQIGAQVEELWAAGAAKGITFQNENCTITQGRLTRKKQSKKEA